MRPEMSAGQFSMMGILILVDCSLWHLKSLSTVPSTGHMCLKTRLKDSGFLKGHCTSQRHPTTFKGLLFCPLFKWQTHQRLVCSVGVFRNRWITSSDVLDKLKCKMTPRGCTLELQLLMVSPMNILNKNNKKGLSVESWFGFKLLAFTSLSLRVQRFFRVAIVASMHCCSGISSVMLGIQGGERTQRLDSGTSALELEML